MKNTIFYASLLSLVASIISLVSSQSHENGESSFDIGDQMSSCVTFKDPSLNESESESCFQAEPVQPNMELQAVRIMALRKSLDGVKEFKIQSQTANTILYSSSKGFKITHRSDSEIVNITLTTLNLPISGYLKIHPIYKTREVNDQEVKKIRIWKVIFLLKLGPNCCRCLTSGDTKLENETNYNCDQFLHLWSTQNLNPSCMAKGPWSVGSNDCKFRVGVTQRRNISNATTEMTNEEEEEDEEEATSKENLTPNEDYFMINRNSFIIGAAFGGGILLVVSSVIGCLLIKKLRDISNRRLENRRSQLRNSFFANQTDQQNHLAQEQRDKNMPDILDTENRKHLYGKNKQKSSSPSASLAEEIHLYEGSHIYAEPDYNDVESNQVENEIYSPAN